MEWQTIHSDHEAQDMDSQATDRADSLVQVGNEDSISVAFPLCLFSFPFHIDPYARDGHALAPLSITLWSALPTEHARNETYVPCRLPSKAGSRAEC